jgi:hypothetical protein
MNLYSIQTLTDPLQRICDDQNKQGIPFFIIKIDSYFAFFFYFTSCFYVIKKKKSYIAKFLFKHSHINLRTHFRLIKVEKIFATFCCFSENSHIFCIYKHEFYKWNWLVAEYMLKMIVYSFWSFTYPNVWKYLVFRNDWSLNFYFHTYVKVVEMLGLFVFFYYNLFQMVFFLNVCFKASFFKHAHTLILRTHRLLIHVEKYVFLSKVLQTFPKTVNTLVFLNICICQTLPYFFFQHIGKANQLCGKYRCVASFFVDRNGLCVTSRDELRALCWWKWNLSGK